MSYELDMSQYLDLFLQEGREQLDILEQETLKLEKDPTQDRLQVIFRAAHTLKGSARAMGYQHFAELTHEMENVLDNLRNGVIQVNVQIADALLQCLDSLNQMVESLANGGTDQKDVAALVSQLQGFVAVGGAPKDVPIESPANASATTESVESNFNTLLDEHHAEELREALSEGPIYQAQFRLTDDCSMKYVRAFMAITEIQKVGEILISVPDAEQLEEENFETDFEIVFQSTNSVEELKGSLARISEVQWHCLKEFCGANDASATEPEPMVIAAPKPSNDPVAVIAAPPASEGSDASGAKQNKAAESGQTVRVDVRRLDALMNLVGELVIDRTRIAQIGDELAQKFDDPNLEALGETVSHINRITGDLQDQIMKARMMPIESVFNRFPRVVRDLANKLDKQIQIDIEGGETELDRSVIESIGDPLLHILRNSIDHGIEIPDERTAAGKDPVGHVLLRARHEENHIIIEISDDGKGIDVARVKDKAVERGLLTKDAAEKMSDKDGLQLIFASGLSTATVVSEVSGRGVGMDIVRSNLQKLGGIIDIESTVGVGSRFTLRLPLTLAIIRGLLVNVGNNVGVIPLGSVIETMLLDTSELQSVNRKDVIVIRGLTTPLVRLRDVFRIESVAEEQSESDQQYVVVVGLADYRIGLIVDSLIGEREVVIKSLSHFCGDVSGISGATILGDGNVALIFDVNGIVAVERAA